MQPSKTDTIYPCPFSKGYGISTRQAWLLLKIFLGYRLISAAVFVMLIMLPAGTLLLGKYDAQLYQVTSLSYLAISLLMTPLIFRRLLDYTHLSQLLIFTDIIFITLLMHACGGVTSGIGGLLAVSIAAAGLLVGGRCAMVFAALATLAVLAEEVYAIQANSFNSAALNYSGLLGISFFTIGLLSVILSQRVEQSASLAKSHEQTIERLEKLNRYIIQHLQSGIMIVDEKQTILLSNQSTLRLLELPELPDNLGVVSELLQQSFNTWRSNPDRDFAIIRLPTQEEIQVRFSQLAIDGESLHMLIFEDVALHKQHLQQGKLASLGRLTASIAHEIRNPLSAISHAGQLLSETPQLNMQEQRLTQIIQTHCLRVNKIIEDVLALSRRKPSQKQKINLDQWLAAYVQEKNQYLAGQSEMFVCIIHFKELNAYVDPDHLKQILDNLCANAMKYGHPEKGNITVEADYIAGDPCIHVVDNGPGISRESLRHLFEPFFTTSHQGTGLGLYISRELAELNQAELSYARRNDKSCFTLSLANADHAVIEI
jgi:two-component system sensor histidine kinase PilS (NtrC family)